MVCNLKKMGPQKKSLGNTALDGPTCSAPLLYTMVLYLFKSRLDYMLLDLFI
jgi:hypothetical protein